MPTLLAAGDPFEHTWNSWTLHFYNWDVHLDAIPGFHAAGISKFVVMMLCAAAIVLFLGLKSGGEAKRAQAEGRVPRGLAHVFEVIIQFVRDDMMAPNMPHHFKSPFLISVFSTFFLFILACNLIGLAPHPFGSTATGSPWVTGALAFGGTLVLIFGAGIYEHGFFGYMAHLAPPAPAAVRWLVLWPIEFIGQIVKPFALMIRLAANMTAGHIILAVLASFLTLSMGWGTAIMVKSASGFGFFAITAFEIAIALIQAYIFTILSIVFVGASLSHEH
jgi:F-type H+-transporting ATPase subunit a